MDMDVKQANMEKIDVAISHSVKGDVPSTKLDKAHHIEVEKSEIIEKEKVARKDVEKMAEKANKELIVYDRRLEYRIHEKTHEIMVKVINTKDDSVVREIPSEKMLDFVANLRERIGINMDERR